MDSKIVNKDDLKSDLMKLCGFPVNQKWLLLYRGSENNFNWPLFHTKCDNKSSTLIITKSKDGNIFGGYTEAHWNDPLTKETRVISQSYNYMGKLKYEQRFKTDLNAFLYILKGIPGSPIKVPVSEPDKAIYCDQYDGPSFGKFDFFIHGYIELLSTKKQDCYFDFGYSYSIQQIQKNPFSKPNLKMIEIFEIEVFQKI